MKNIKNFENYIETMNELSTSGMRQYAKELDHAQKTGDISAGNFKRQTQRENDYSCSKCGKGMSNCTCGKEKQTEPKKELVESIIMSFKDFK